MVDTGRVHDAAEKDGSGSWQQWQASVQLLQLLQSDYQLARKQLEDVCRIFGDREYTAREHLRSALEIVTEAENQRADGLRGSAARTVDVPLSPFGQTSQVKNALTALAPLRVSCLGRFEVRLGWNKLDSWRGIKAKLLLKYLIAQRGRPLPKDVIMETLWPECDPRAGNNNLKAAVHALRQTLNHNGTGANGKGGSLYVLFLEGSYMINPKADLWVDVDEFEYHWMVGRRLEREGRVDEALKSYESAERLYRGDYLEEDPYEEWTLLRREALKDTYLTILNKLGEHSVKQEDYEGGIVYWQKILSKDPCREDAYRGLIRCHSRLGQRSCALHWYKLCIRTLKAELNTVPDRETAVLHDRLLEGDYI